MSKAVFFMHTGKCDEQFIKSALTKNLNQEVWCIVGEPLPSMYGIYDNHERAGPVVNWLYQSFRNHAKGLVDTSDLFIKNYSQQVAIKFGDDLRLVHVVRDPLEVATLLGDSECSTEDPHKKHIHQGKHVKRQEGWNAFQQHLWEWVDCHITATFLSEQIGAGKTLVLPHYYLWYSGTNELPELIDWVAGEDSEPFEPDQNIWTSRPEFYVNQQHIVDSFTWFNGLPDREQRMVVMLFKKLMGWKALVEPPQFVADKLSQ